MASPPPPKRGFNWRPIATAASIGTGIAAIAGGTILILVDGPVIEGGRREPQANETLGLGIVTLGGGVALVGLGAWLWAQHVDDTSSSLVLGVSGDGAAIGYKGAF